MKRIPAFLVVVLAASTLRAAAWMPFSEPPRTRAAAYDQRDVVVASDGFDYFAAWTTETPQGPQVYGTRIDRDGSVDAPIAMAVDQYSRWSAGVSVTRGRDGYLLAWLSDRGLNTAITDAFGRPERTTVVTGSTDQPIRTLSAWSGSSYLALSGSYTGIRGALLDNNGFVLQPVDAGHFNTQVTALIADSRGFFLLATKNTGGYSEIYGRRITASGVAGEWFLVRQVATQVSALVAAWDGTRDVLAWTDSVGIWLTEIDPQNDSVTQARQISPSGRVAGLIKEGGRTWISFHGADDRLGRFVTVGVDGSVSSPLRIGDNADGGALATNGTSILTVALASERAGTYVNDVVGTFLTSSPGSTQPFTVSKSQTEQRVGDLATDGSRLVSAWEETIDGYRHVFVNSTNDLVKVGPGVQLSTAGDNLEPAIALNGSAYLVAWLQKIEGKTSVLARRVDALGKPLDSVEIVIADDLGFWPGTPVKVASNGVEWVVVWTKALMEQPGCGSIGPATRVFGARVSADGIVLEPGGKQLIFDRSDQFDIDIAWDGARYVAAWRTQCLVFEAPRTFPFPPSSGVSRGFISADLRYASSAALVFTGTHAYDGARPAVAVAGRQSLIAWSTGGETEYVIVDRPASSSTSRTRAVLPPPEPPSRLEGSLLAASGEGGFHILTRQTPPGSSTASIYDNTIAPDGTKAAISWLTSLSDATKFMGHLISWSRHRYVTAGIFQVMTGAQRLWAWGVD